MLCYAFTKSDIMLIKLKKPLEALLIYHFTIFINVNRSMMEGILVFSKY